MGKSNSCCKFYFNKLHIRWTKGKVPPAATFQEYSQDENLCVVRALDEYICSIFEVEIWRRAFSTFVKCYPSIHSSTISRWLKGMLMKSGVDTDTFKGHSIRFVSTSKAGLRSASTEQILKQECWYNISAWPRFYNKSIVRVL